MKMEPLVTDCYVQSGLKPQGQVIITKQLAHQEEIPFPSGVGNIVALLGNPKEYIVICYKGHLN